MDFLHLCKVVSQITNTRVGIDCIIPQHIKRMGVTRLRRVLNVLNQPTHTQLEESISALHMAVEKGVGDDIKLTRAIKILSALLRLRANVLNRHLQSILSPEDWATRQFVVYKGANAVGLRRLLHTLVHVGHNRGGASMVFLNIAAVFDEVVQTIIETVADMLLGGGGGSVGARAVL